MGQLSFVLIEIIQGRKKISIIEMNRSIMVLVKKEKNFKQKSDQ